MTEFVGTPDGVSTVQLQSIFLHVTKACNLRCKYCYFSADKPLPDEMTTDDFARLWPDLVRLHPQKIIFTGGEPLLRPDILHLLAGLRDADPDHGIVRCLNTNGHFVTPEIAYRLIGLIDEARVSLDALQARNDALRGSGNFEDALRALDYFSQAGFEPKVLVTITSPVLPDLEELLCFLIARKITRINVNIFKPVGRGKDHPQWSVSPENVRAAVAAAWHRAFPSFPAAPLFCGAEPFTNCGVGSFLNIMPNGNVFPCHVLTGDGFRCGNVKNQSLAEICRRSGLLGRMQSLDFRELVREEPRLGNLDKPGACLGETYSLTSDSSIWRDSDVTRR